MAELVSVGLDVGTTSTQMVVSRLSVENRAGAFAVPELDITGREILYRSPVYFTPLLGENRVDGEKIRQIVDSEYEKAGLRRENVDTGAIIITGETSRKENARAVLEALSDYAGEFVVATAGPDLESVLAAKGAGAVALSEKTGKRVLHMDIGGGTSNLAWIEDGRIVATGCLNVGGRLVKLDKQGRVTYLSSVLDGLTDLKIGDFAGEELKKIAEKLVSALEMAAGLREPTDLLEKLWTKETVIARSEATWQSPSDFENLMGIATPVCGPARNDTKNVLSFSGGVADCIETDHGDLEFGDMGPVLGRAIRKSRLCAGEYVLGTETIRATVIGAGCHATQLSGSTVFCQNVCLPLKNLPVLDAPSAQTDHPTPIYALEGTASPSYARIAELAQQLIIQTQPPYYFCIRQDMAKALGQALAARLPKDASILCLDRVAVSQGSYLDIAPPVAQAFPVVIKTLVLGNDTKE